MRYKPNCYLAGKMSGLTFEEMNNWRIEATSLLLEYFNIINPVDYYNFEIDKNIFTDYEVKEFDLQMVKNSKIIILNLDHPDSIGTAIEVHMAHDEWKIPVIAYGGDLDNVHPWIKVSITKCCKTLEEVVNHVYKYYLPNF